LWEIFTLGDTPFASVPAEEFQEYLRRGITLSQPSLCPPDAYQVMRRCWNMQPELRPNWNILVHTLEDLANSKGIFCIFIVPFKPL